MKTKYLAKVLMCQPSYFRVDYQINPWMKPGSVNQAKAREQWDQLLQTYQKLGVEVDVINQYQALPDMVFSTDQASVYQNKAVMSNFHHQQRKAEVDHYFHWYYQHQFVVSFLPNNIDLEGGDVIQIGDKIFVGVGFRSDVQATQHLAEMFNLVCFSLELIDPYYYHLDTCLFGLNDQIVFYYPAAFSQSAQQVLKKNIAKLIPLTEKEVSHFAANSISTDHHVIMQKGNDSFKNKIEDLGYKVIELDISEFIKAGGGIKCLTGVIQEVYQ